MDPRESTKALADKGKALGGEFRQFVAKGSVIDMAVGIIIGAGFGKIVTSFVADVIMPPVGLLLNRVDFKDLKWTLATAADGKAVSMNYGLFVQTVIDFLIVACVIFLMVKLVARMNRKAEVAAPVTTKECPMCVMVIPIKAVKCGHCTSEVGA